MKGFVPDAHAMDSGGLHMNYQQAYAQAQEALGVGDSGRALALLKQAAALAQQEGEIETAIDILQAAHPVAEERGQLEHAASLLERAIELTGGLNDPAVLGGLLNNLALTQKRAGHFTRARETLKRAVDVFQPLVERENEYGTAWNNLGYVERDLGNLQEALSCHQKALDVFERTGDSAGMVRTLLEIGIVHKDLGQLTQARADLERALSLPTYQDESALRDRGHALIGLGLTHQLLNDDQNAQRCYEEALALYRQVRDRENEALALHNLGQLYDDRADLETARTYYLQALAINEEIGAALGAADDLGSLSAIYQAQGDDEQAMQMQQEALRQYEAMGFREGQVDTLVDLGILARNRRHLAEAEQYMTQALALTQEMGNPRLLYEVFLNRGDVYLFAGKLRRASQDYTEAIAAAESIRINLLLEQEALSFFGEARLEAYDRLVRLYARGLRQPQLSLQWVERAKSREFLRRLSVSRLAPARHIPAALLQQEDQWLARLREAASALEAPDTSDRRAVLRDYETAAEKLRATWNAIERYDKEYADLRRGEPLSWRELKRLLTVTSDR